MPARARPAASTALIARQDALLAPGTPTRAVAWKLATGRIAEIRRRGAHHRAWVARLLDLCRADLVGVDRVTSASAEPQWTPSHDVSTQTIIYAVNDGRLRLRPGGCDRLLRSAAAPAGVPAGASVQLASPYTAVGFDVRWLDPRRQWLSTVVSTYDRLVDACRALAYAGAHTPRGAYPRWRLAIPEYTSNRRAAWPTDVQVALRYYPTASSLAVDAVAAALPLAAFVADPALLWRLYALISVV